MNQRHPQNISHVIVDWSSMVENVFREKNGTMISVSGCKNPIKHQVCEEACAVVLVHVLVSVIMILRSVNTWKMDKTFY